MIELSVIICTHNPTTDYLKRTLNALRNQSFDSWKWELTLVDNSSATPVADIFDLSWHPHARHIREEKLGLTPARIRGINEAKGELILFVDDDNCLLKNYLEVATTVMRQFPLLGVLGAGKIIPDFEVAPSYEIAPFLRMLTLRSESRAHYSNEIRWNKALPFGAGMCIRKKIADHYVELCNTRLMATTLGRAGKILLSGEDIDMALHACQLGFISGVIPELELIHIIPKGRLDKHYLIKLAAGHEASHYYLSKLWGYAQEYPENRVLKLSRYWKTKLANKGFARDIFIAKNQALEEARLIWKRASEKELTVIS